MVKCISDLQVPCRWVPDLGAGYGYPLFNYYGPLPYYFGAISFFLTGSLLLSVKLMFAVSFLGAYVFMYLLGKKLWGELGGVISAVLYSFAPYHAVDLYVRGAMGEMWGLMFFPAVFWSLIRLRDSLKIRDCLIASICLFGLITSHNLSAMIFLPFTGILMLILIRQKFSLRFFRLTILSVVLGLSLAAFYLLPVLFEKNLVHVDSTIVGYFSYTEHFKGFKKLLIDRSWGYGASVREVPGGEKDSLPYQIGTIHVIIFAIFLFMLIKLFKNEKRNLILFFTLATIFSTFMIHPRSLPIWQILDPLKYIQFPWRLLGLVIFFLSLSVGSIFIYLQKYKKIKMAVFVSLLVLTFVLNFSYFQPEKLINTTDQELLSGESYNYQITRSVFDFLPKSAAFPPAKIADKKYEINPEEVEITNFLQGTNWMSFNAKVDKLTFIKLSTYYFPNFEVYANGQRREINSNNELGLITFTLDPGQYFIKVQLFDTPVRIIANILTMMGLLLFTILLLTQISKTRKWILYYLKRIG
jgi:hypothetical protein